MSNVTPCKYRDPLTGLFCTTTPTHQTGFCDVHMHLGFSNDHRCTAMEYLPAENPKEYRCWRKVASATTTLCSTHGGV